ncbi:hypothetical protein FVEN_g5196 [Fusarium venenatum]|uniref:Expansin-like EG45 domain-containing protein n=1 Tax=Fusarium venenatum TaxID=56646 RepID=A0A2L2SZS4_9HYPO|nr:uncharacterized protein FVRRES_07104 [Fusarium venenatum]KAG8357112.1 hypothetical protein FVEN_g5196 [Fusarium venenatum]KAH6994051.1 RlpA-like double-psi beta-barrel-protein domain-containing protein-containing protein [Fusarium venenatum]CEI62668.1 unnamed protein product [Fusarium venenatum]
MKFLSILLAVPALVAGRYLSDEVNSGTSTHYGGNVGGGACGLVAYTIPSGIYGTAFSGPNWNNAGVCGSCIEVTGPTGKKIKAMIVDRCNECNKGHLDLFEDAFTAVGGTNGLVQTSWRSISCDITSPLVLRNKEGTSAFWFSMQVRNSNLPVKSLEVSTDNGKSWIGTTRKEYNFFENPSGFRTETVDVRVTSSTGSTIIVKGVGVKPQTEFKAASNFP